MKKTLGRNKIHVCIVTHVRIGETTGGIETIAPAYYRWLKKEKHSATMVHRTLSGSKTYEDNKAYNKDGEHSEEKKVTSVRVPHLFYIIYNMYTTLNMIIRVTRINSKEKIYAIHAEGTPFPALTAIIASRIIGAKSIIKLHGWYPDFMRVELQDTRLEGVYTAIDVILGKIVAKNCDIMIAECENYAKVISDKLPIEKERIEVLPECVDERFGEIKKEKEKSEIIKISYIGRIVAIKNLRLLIYGFNEASKSNTDIKLDIIGDGKEREALEKETNRISKDKRISFLGSKRNIIKNLQETDIFVLPSISEGTPVSLLEAMYSGKAIIASKIPPIEEILTNNQDSILVDPNDINEMKEAILKLANDEEMRRRIGESASKRAQQFSYNEIFRKLISITTEKAHYSALPKKM